MDPLTYPIIFRYADMTVPSGADFTKVWQIKFRNESEFDTVESVRPGAEFHWIIDGNAKLRTISLQSRSREWLRPVRHIWRGVREHYSIGEAQEIKVSQFETLLNGTRLDEEKSLTAALRKYLDDQDESAVFTKSMFREFMQE